MLDSIIIYNDNCVKVDKNTIAENVFESTKDKIDFVIKNLPESTKVYVIAEDLYTVKITRHLSNVEYISLLAPTDIKFAKDNLAIFEDIDYNSIEKNTAFAKKYVNDSIKKYRQKRLSGDDRTLIAEYFKLYRSRLSNTIDNLLSGFDTQVRYGEDFKGRIPNYVSDSDGKLFIVLENKTVSGFIGGMRLNYKEIKIILEGGN